jgi:acyl transferase domain-containing protein/NAD(P)H-dependent flavin oxidoreductase YrpB (nitropropane dioxygenase family)/NAD(P)-dependent dehydrogenase (short-subunit alcohol dehydrogenase family)
VVLDHQTLLLPESPLPKRWQRLIESAQGQDFQILGGQGQTPVTVLAHPAFPALGELQRAARALELEGAKAQVRFDEAVDRLVRLGPPEQCLWPLGQVAGWAAWTRDHYLSIGHLVKSVQDGSLQQVRSATSARPLSPNAPLAASHGTRYPIVQGPMTRVSDRPLFARAVADNGALPMVALALAKAEEARAVLDETASLLGETPWGVGILGFVTPDVLEAQLKEVLRVKPPFALIAGGRPRQALALESEGIATYLHVPVPSLLASFLDQGARRFIFEGRECGGHVGPLSSFVLWEQAVETLLSRLPAGEKASLLFAGGVHDARSAAMVSALAAPLVEAGMEIGVLMGTAYLFTEEAVQTGAIGDTFQKVALQCGRTVTLDSAVGQANRCAETPFARAFYEEKKRLLSEGASAETIHKELDQLLLGRLRQATRGTKRDQSGVMVTMEPAEQLSDGMFMIGEVATLRHSVVSMSDLHQDVCQGPADHYLKAEAEEPASAAGSKRAPAPCDIAIIGMALHVPGAHDKNAFWANLLAGHSFLSEVPESRWDWRLYFDPNKHAPDRSYSRWGGWVDDFVFDPLSFGLPPNRWNSINSSQAISLELARQAIHDAGYRDRPFPRHRTATVLASGDSGMFGGALLTRAMLALLAPEVPQSLLDKLPEWTEDSFPGVLASLCSGRVANRLDLGGSNFIVDAACASSLTAVDMGCHELVSGRADCAIVGGVDIGQTPFDFIGFSKVQALSPTGQVRPFDRRADGIVISEGACFMVLKRLEDAERDGDRVYAVIRAVGTSSDGRTMGLTAPCAAGQARALESAWQLCGLDPANLDLYEAHATGTALGDSTELKTIVSLLGSRQAEARQCAIGSVKSLVGHTKRAAGLVSLAKTALSLYHGVLPPHLGASEPLETLRSSSAPVCLHTQAQPWFRRPGGKRRLASVSAFGFGGTNAHLILEEAPAARDAAPGAASWPVELVLLEEQPGYPLDRRVRDLLQSLEQADVPLRDLAYSLTLDLAQVPQAGRCAALVVDSLQSLREGLQTLSDHLRNGVPLPAHILVGQRHGTRVGKLAFLFPGQGSQYPSPARELALYFPEFRQTLQEANEALADCYPRPLTRLAYPPLPMDKAEEEKQRLQLRDTHLAQPLLGALSIASFSLLRRLGFAPDCLAGHSYGEFAALQAAGAMSYRDLLTLSEARGRAMANLGSPDAGAMAAVSAPRSQVEEFLIPPSAVVVANHNSPDQTVIAGPSGPLKEVLNRLREHGIRTVNLAVSGGFHSPAMAPAQNELVKTIRKLKLVSPNLPVYSNLNGQPYPTDPTAIVEQMQEHLLSSVEFVAQIQSMSRDGVRTFLEMAPGSVLSGLVRQILDLPELLVAGLDQRGEGLAAFLKMLGQLRNAGMPFSPEALFDGRDVRRVDPLALPKEPPVAPTSWIVNPGFIRPASDPEPKLGRSALLSSLTVKDAQPLPPAVEAPAEVAPPLTPPQAQPAPGGSVLPPSPPESTSPLSDARVVEAYVAYQQTMQQFLRTQEQVMAGFLQAVRGTAPVSGSSTLPGFPSAHGPGAEIPAPFLTPDSGVTLPPAPAPAPESRVTSPPSSAAEQTSTVADRADIERELVRIVARRTGYPAEMLGLNSDLEGHLGIDSIKRLEIVEDLLSGLAGSRAGELRDEAERLIRLRTLSELAESLWGLLAEPTADSQAVDSKDEPAQPLPLATAPEDDEPASRFLMRARPAEPPSGSPPPGTYLLLGSPDRLTLVLADRLRSLGCDPIVVSPEARESWPESLREVTQIAAVICLVGLEKHPFPDTLESLRVETERQLKSLFWLLQLCGPLRLARSLLLITSRAGEFGRRATGTGSPLSAAALGLARTLATEWPEARCVGLDLDDKLSRASLLDILCQELLSEDAEVCYRKGRRFVFEPVRAPLEPAPTALKLDSDWVVLATGGARGITAQLLLALARPGMRIALAGRTPLPAESEEQASLTTAEALRAHFISSRPGCSPLEIERAVHSVLRSREVAENLRAFEQLGCRVSYHPIDVTNRQALSALVQSLYEEQAKIDAVFHGAGVIEDRLLEDKTEDSFDRVFHTKIDPVLHLQALLRPEDLKLLLLFSSVAGRFGNRGQADYAAANEMLNRWGMELARRWKQTRVLSINWGPWAGEGMAGEGHQKAFLARGIIPIARAAGIAFLRDELAGDRGEVEVIAGEGDWAELLQSTARGRLWEVPTR